MKYLSTRGSGSAFSFKDVVMTGLARDGGLFLPETLPNFSPVIDKMTDMDYCELAFHIMREFTDMDESHLRDLIDRSYAVFRHPEIAPVVKAGKLHVLELFHGPTLAFKDIALQFLGNLFEYYLSREDARLNIVAATSGDTGSAAIHGVRGKKGMRIFVMFPRGRVSPIQERQMTTVLDGNVFNIAVEGSFDDCQAILKSLFNDLLFRDSYHLGSVNSINWARLLAQIVYYFHSASRVMKSTGAPEVQFAVPTGNFGDIFAGYLAAKMGLPIRRLILATNENDILSRFFRTGIYKLGEVCPSISPSMDIQVASNFERYLYYLVGGSSQIVVELMSKFGKTGEIHMEKPGECGIDKLFRAGSCDTATTISTIGRYYSEFGYLLDPHTAVGVNVAENEMDEDTPVICLATAHPAKFSAPVLEATGKDLAHHEILDSLAGLPTRVHTSPGTVDAVKEYVSQSIGG